MYPFNHYLTAHRFGGRAPGGGHPPGCRLWASLRPSPAWRPGTRGTPPSRSGGGPEGSSDPWGIHTHTRLMRTRTPARKYSDTRKHWQPLARKHNHANAHANTHLPPHPYNHKQTHKYPTTAADMEGARSQWAAGFAWTRKKIPTGTLADR